MRAFRHQFDTSPASNSSSASITVDWSRGYAVDDSSNGGIVCGFESLEAEAAQPSIESWQLDDSVKKGCYRDVLTYTSEDSCFAITAIELAENTCLRTVTEALYTDLLNAFVESGHSVPFRLWNIIPDINAEAGSDQERYKQFCIGREAAIHAVYGTGFNDYPAASAVGNQQNQLIVFGFSSRETFHRIENPRQVSAYHYPRQYGPVSPSFARAALSPDRSYLFISGTASIVGHESLHIGDLHAQTQETIRNIEQLVEEANQETGPADHYRLTLLRVYLRDKNGSDTVKGLLSSTWPMASIQILEADICREELLVEVEALGQKALA